MDLIESEITKDTSRRHPWEKARLEVVKDLLKKYLPDLKAYSAEVLDIGCGDAWLIKEISKHYPKAHFTAVDSEFSNQMLEDFRSKFDPKHFSFSNTVNEGIEGSSQIQLTLLLDVIEHIEYEVDFLKELIKNNQSINSNTTFLITVPAFQGLFSEHDKFLKHFRRYNKKTLTNSLNDSGLEVIDVGYFFSSLLLPRTIIKLLEKSGLKAKKAKGIGSHEEKAYDNLVTHSLIFDYKFHSLLRRIGISLPGLSCFAIAKPKTESAN